MPKSKLRYLVIGLLAIVVIYTLYYMTFVYVSYYSAIPRRVRHLGRLLSILLVYGAGFHAFKKYEVKWIRALWNYVYIIVLSVLILTGLYDWALGPAPAQVRNMAKTLHEFLISPVLYAGILIINRMLGKLR